MWLVHIYIYIYVDVHIYVYTRTHICVYIYIYTYIHTYTHTYTYQHTCMYIPMNIAMHIYIYTHIGLMPTALHMVQITWSATCCVCFNWHLRQWNCRCSMLTFRSRLSGSSLSGVSIEASLSIFSLTFRFDTDIVSKHANFSLRYYICLQYIVSKRVCLESVREPVVGRPRGCQGTSEVYYIVRRGLVNYIVHIRTPSYIYLNARGRQAERAVAEGADVKPATRY